MKKQTKTIRASRRILRFVLAVCVLGSIAMFLVSVASVSRCDEAQKQSAQSAEAFLSTQNPLYFQRNAEIPHHIRTEMLEILTKCYGAVQANQLVFLLESKQKSLSEISSHIQVCSFGKGGVR